MNKIQFGGLKPHIRDKRDFSHKKTYGVFDLSQLPDEYILPSIILDQKLSYKCTAFSSCAYQDAQEGIGFDPDWFYAKEGEIEGEVSEYGYSLRTALKTGVKAGFKPLIRQDNNNMYLEDSFFAVDCNFDAIRIALWLARAEKRSCLAGTMWFSEWTYTQGGIIPETYSEPVGLHAIVIKGWKKINGITYLIIQNSYGTSVGDNGLHYFPKNVVNKEFKQGLFMWREKPDPNQIKTIRNILDCLKDILLILQKMLFLKV